MSTSEALDQTQPPVRHHSLDSLRAVMMLLGIAIHAVLPYLPPEPGKESKLPFYDESAANLAYLLVVFFIHSFRMPVFFVMAGFFAAMMQERRGTRALLFNRFQRIVVPFAVGWVILFPLLSGTTAYFQAGGGSQGRREVVTEFFRGRLYHEASPIHLWFLYYLIFLYPLALGASALWSRLGPATRARLDAGFRHTLQSPIRPVYFAIPTMLTYLLMVTGLLDTPETFKPSLAILSAYAVFFSFGWMLHAHVDLLPRLSRHAWKYVNLAMVLWPLSTFAMVMYLMAKPGYDPVAHALTVISGALTTWLFVFGITGLFIRYFNRSFGWMRYVTDASYWCYLAHLPLLFWLAAILAPLPFASPVKVVLLIVLATSLLLVAYHHMVRTTFIGEWLNGRRHPGRIASVEERLPEEPRLVGVSYPVVSEQPG
ncbi:acyltransferase family protein [Singulisphaera rosea]